PLCDGHLDRRHELVGAEGRREIAREELPRCHRPAPRGGGEGEPRIERHYRHRQFGGGVGVSKAPAQGSEGPHANVADEARDLWEKGGAPTDLREVLQLVVTGQRSEVPRSVLDSNAGERQSGDLDDEAGPGEPVIEEGD